MSGRRPFWLIDGKAGRDANIKTSGFPRRSDRNGGALEAQQHRASGLALVTAATALWNTTYLDRALHSLRRHGESVADELLAHLAPVGSLAQNVTGHDLGLPQKWGLGGNRRLRMWVVGGLESLSEAGTERAIVDGAANLEQKIGPSS
jgi:Tn3 transposase DDE domain